VFCKSHADKPCKKAIISSQNGANALAAKTLSKSGRNGTRLSISGKSCDVRVTASPYLGVFKPTENPEIFAQPPARAVIFAQNNTFILRQKRMAGVTARQ
jgi:hypothetical protein